MQKYWNIFRDYTTVLSLNTTLKCFITLTKGIAVQHISCLYYCFVPLNYTITKSVNQWNEHKDPMLYYLKSMTLFYGYKVDRYISKETDTILNICNVM